MENGFRDNETLLKSKFALMSNSYVVFVRCRRVVSLIGPLITRSPNGHFFEDGLDFNSRATCIYLICPWHDMLSMCTRVTNTHRPRELSQKKRTDNRRDFPTIDSTSVGESRVAAKAIASSGKVREWGYTEPPNVPRIAYLRVTDIGVANLSILQMCCVFDTKQVRVWSAAR